MSGHPSYRCGCRCHTATVREQQRYPDGVDVRDVIEALVSCESCARLHRIAFLIANEPPQTPPPTPQYGEGSE